MNSAAKKIDPLDLLPDVPINSIARSGDISPEGVEGSARRLGIQILRTPTGRASVTPRDAVKIISELRDRARERNAGIGP